MPSTMPDKTPAVFNYLKKCAAEERTATYLEIAKKVGLPKPTDVPNRLNHIRDKVCRPRGLPWITVLAVSAQTGLPGRGWFPHGDCTPDKSVLLFLSNMVRRVLAEDWSQVEIENPD